MVEINNTLINAVRQLLQNGRSFLVVSHIRPDGDAIGSLLGLGMALQHASKDVQMVLVDGVSHSFHHLPGSELVLRRPNAAYDTAIVLDCSDLVRTGGVLGERQPDLNIDHHITNLSFARINFVNPSAAATSAILAGYLEDWGLTITTPVAEALMTGLVSDTIGFRTSNVTPETLRLAAKLMERGANLSDLYSRALLHRSFESALYWGPALSRLQRNGRLIWTSLTLADRELANYNGNDDADLINTLSSIDESDIALVFIEQKGKRVKVSWRSQNGYDVSQIALQFGGGGHPAAAGVELVGELESVQAMILKATQKMMENNIFINE
ncbi:MAG: bifunctional oligoribonuclease/PAP phosphatase NrnA [Anaerolineaceae bacterium]|nr:bifunctional oligoribonuclease/PAP phosphatase NrnA [Anaerolineaceae bacterium]